MDNKIPRVGLFSIVFFLLAITVPSVAFGQTQCIKKFPVTVNGATQNLLYCSNKDLDTPDPSIKRLIIVVHGDGRAANTSFANMVKAANAAKSTDSLIIAPRYTTSSDVNDSSVLTWTSTGWKEGAISTSTVKVSTYTVTDNLIKHVANKSKFPNLKRIIFTGFSGGGQMTSRYGPANTAENELAGAGYSFRYIIASPSNYLYTTSDRPSGNAFGPPTGCPTFDNYKYGLKNLNEYTQAVGIEKLKSQLQQRNIGIFIGGSDTGSADSTCAAKVQGSGRLDRGNKYYKYLSSVYGQSVYTNHFIAITPGAGHNSGTVYASAQSRPYLFDAIAETPLPTLASADNPPAVPSGYCLGASCPTMQGETVADPAHTSPPQPTQAINTAPQKKPSTQSPAGRPSQSLIMKISELIQRILGQLRNR